MKITETTPKVERTFTIELTEVELQTLRITCGEATHADVETYARKSGIKILPYIDAHLLFIQLKDVIKGVSK